MSNPKHYRVEWFNDDLDDGGFWLEPKPYNVWTDFLHEPFQDRRPGTANKNEAERWASDYSTEFGYETRVVTVDSTRVFELPPKGWFIAYVDREGRDGALVRSFWTSAISTDATFLRARAWRTMTAAREQLRGRKYTLVRLSEYRSGRA